MTRLINMIFSLNFLRVGLSSTEFILDAGDVARIEALDRDRSAPIECTHGPPNLIKARALNKGVITVLIQSCGEHCDRRITIQRWQNDAFYNGHLPGSSRSFIKIRWLQLFETVHDGPFHHNRRSF